jgi:hypothetical protein
MSFCRMSDDNWKSDVYAFEDDGGFVVHVAANRLVGDIPEVPYILDVGPEVWGKAHQAQMTAVSAAERAPIGGPHDGESFRYATLRELHDGLLQLRADGYRVPQFALDDIANELSEENDETTEN